MGSMTDQTAIFNDGANSINLLSGNVHTDFQVKGQGKWKVFD